MGNPQGKHFDIVQLCHLETMQKQNLHLVIDYEIISIHGNILSSGRTALDHIVIPNEYALQQAYPNPFNPWTNISFTLTEATVTDIVIYNSLGKEVDKLTGRTLFDIGTHTIRWDAEDVPSGVYLIRLETPLASATTKAILIK